MTASRPTFGSRGGATEFVVSEAVWGGHGWVSVEYIEAKEGTVTTVISGTETGGVTGVKDKDYNIVWFVEQCLSNSLRLETYIADAGREGDEELAAFFRRAQRESRKGAEQGKTLLRQRLG